MPPVNQPLKQSGYVNRKFDDDLDVLLKSFKIVEIEGVLGCGKTWTALAHAQSATTLGDTKMVLPIIQANPHIALTGVAPHLIDDWTNLPELQELMYRESGRPGSYISVSSHIPQTEDIYVRRHAARGVKVRMRTCTIDELGFSRRDVAWEDIVAGRFSPGSTTLELERTARLICSGGWPAGIGQEDGIARQTAECCVEEAILQVSTVFKKKVPTASAALTAIADGAGEDTNYPALTKRIEQLGAKPPSRTTLSTYLGILERLCLIERVQGWDAPIRSKSRVRTKPRYFPVDCSVSTSMRQLAANDLLGNAPLFQACLKSMVLHELLCRVDSPASKTPGRVCYYSDADGLEIDFILLFDDGSWAPINVELGEHQVTSSAKRIARLYNKLASNEGSGIRPPAFSAIILGSAAKRSHEKISDSFVFPITDLY